MNTEEPIDLVPSDPSPDLTEYVVPSTAGEWRWHGATEPRRLFIPHWAKEEL